MQVFEYENQRSHSRQAFHKRAHRCKNLAAQLRWLQIAHSLGIFAGDWYPQKCRHKRRDLANTPRQQLADARLDFLMPGRVRFVDAQIEIPGEQIDKRRVGRGDLIGERTTL